MGKRSRTLSSSSSSCVVSVKKPRIIDIEYDSDNGDLKEENKRLLLLVAKLKEEKTFEKEFSKVFDESLEKSLFKKIEDLTSRNTKLLKDVIDKEVVIRDLEKNAKEIVEEGLKFQITNLNRQVTNLNLTLSRKNQIVENLQRVNEELRWNFQNFRDTIFNFLASMYPNVLNHFNVFTNNF